MQVDAIQEWPGQPGLMRAENTVAATLFGSDGPVRWRGRNDKGSWLQSIGIVQGKRSGERLARWRFRRSREAAARRRAPVPGIRGVRRGTARRYAPATLAGSGVRAAADKRGHRRGMVRRTERPTIRQLSAGEIARDRMDHRDFQEFARRQRRQYRWQARRQHALAGAGRPIEKQIVSAGCGDLQRPFRALLPLDVAKIGLRTRQGFHRRNGPRQHLRSMKMVGDLN